ncbi:hypothetical protein AB9P05_00885 [Roseivirga sp. BDSF3-8]|uniref:hypothetical protein n=1 Tax=Roseivirga sp. BDSF3-8 TaxID=3241598 RepID=UPI0035322B51
MINKIRTMALKKMSRLISDSSLSKLEYQLYRLTDNYNICAIMTGGLSSNIMVIPGHVRYGTIEYFL